MNTKNVTVAGAGVAAAPAVEPTPHKPQHFGELEPIEPQPSENRRSYQ